MVSAVDDFMRKPENKINFFDFQIALPENPKAWVTGLLILQ